MDDVPTRPADRLAGDLQSQITDGSHEGQPGRDEAQHHEADVQGGGEEGRCRALHPGVESVTAALGVVEVHDGEDEGGDSDEDWPEGDEEVRQGGVDDRRVASYIFENVEPMTLDDDSWKIRLGRQTGRTEAHIDAQRIMFKMGRPSPISKSIARARRFCWFDHKATCINTINPLCQTERGEAYLGGCLVRGGLSNQVENPPLHGQDRSGNPNGGRDRNPRSYTTTRKQISTRCPRKKKKEPEEGRQRTELTDIAPHWCPVHDIPIPHDRIDEGHEGREAGPEDEQARAGTPAGGFGEVPSERDGRGGKGEEGEDGERVVGCRHFSSAGEEREREREGTRRRASSREKRWNCLRGWQFDGPRVRFNTRRGCMEIEIQEQQVELIQHNTSGLVLKGCGCWGSSNPVMLATVMRGRDKRGTPGGGWGGRGSVCGPTMLIVIVSVRVDEDQ